MSPTTWKCEVCGFIHQGAEPPDTCPVCGVGREMFAIFEIAAPQASPLPAQAWRCTVCDHVHQEKEAPGLCPVCGAEQRFFEHFVPMLPQSGDHLVRRVVIVGAGIAGLTAAEHARRTSPSTEITLISKEAGLPYYRINLTRLLAGQISEEQLQLQQATWFEQQRIKVLPGEVLTIDRERHELHLREGATLPYDRLILTNGAHAFIPPIAGIHLDGVYALRTLEDARAILQEVTPGKPCLCLGGGLLGLETAGALARLGMKVTVLEGFGWLLPRQLTEPAGQLLEQHLLRIGLQVRTGAKTEEIMGDERVRAVRLASGEELPAQMVVLGTGVRPNSYLARQAQLKVKGGIIVDDRMFTSDGAILAAGDVAEHRGILYGIWPTAYAQGVIAGTNAVGGQLEFRTMAPSNRLKVLDVDLFSIGQFQPPDGSYQIVEQQVDNTYWRFTCRDGQLVGANLYGDTRLAGLVKEAVESGAQLAALPELLEQVPQLAQLCQNIPQPITKE
jgi:nitrite reductase (NADH) large subunit